MSSLRMHRHSPQNYIGPKAQERREAMLEALRTVLKSTPWRSVKISDITGPVGCSNALFYDYFETLEEAFWELWLKIYAEKKGGSDIPLHLEKIHGLLVYESTMGKAVKK
jgi:AcrR family transcriptional regulator